MPGLSSQNKLRDYPAAPFSTLTYGNLQNNLFKFSYILTNLNYVYAKPRVILINYLFKFLQTHAAHNIPVFYRPDGLNLSE